MGIKTKPTPNNNKGGGGRGGSGGSGGSSKKSTQNTSTSSLRVGIDGNWQLLNPEEASVNLDNSKWVFNLSNGGRAKGWAYLSYTFEGKTKSEWYHFAEDGIMDSGWFLDGSTWYYLSMNHNGFFGEMIKGWHHDGQDGRWYYLDPSSGAMHTNWSKIGGDYYFLNPTATAQTWFFDNATDRWNFGDVNSRPYGSMYQNETTPDGYHVNASGAWVQNGAVQTRNVRATGQTTYTKSNSKSEEKKSNSNSNNSNRENSSDTRGEARKKTKKSQYLLYKENSSYKNYVYKEKNLRVIGGETWTDVLHFEYAGGMVEYSNEAGYTKLRATVAPRFSDWDSEQGKTAELIVYGDNSTILYESGDIATGETQPFDIEVDISGQSKVQLALSGTNGHACEVILKSARFED